MQKKAVFKKHKQAVDKIEKKQDEVSHIWFLMGHKSCLNFQSKSSFRNRKDWTRRRSRWKSKWGKNILFRQQFESQILSAIKAAYGKIDKEVDKFKKIDSQLSQKLTEESKKVKDLQKEFEVTIFSYDLSYRDRLETFVIGQTV